MHREWCGIVNRITNQSECGNLPREGAIKCQCVKNKVAFIIIFFFMTFLHYWLQLSGQQVNCYNGEQRKNEMPYTSTDPPSCTAKTKPNASRLEPLIEEFVESSDNTPNSYEYKEVFNSFVHERLRSSNVSENIS